MDISKINWIIETNVVIVDFNLEFDVLAINIHDYGIRV